MRHAPRIVLLVGALGGLASGRVALAQEAGDVPSARLEWSAPKECIAGGALAAAVSRQLGRAAFVSSAQAELVVRGRVAPSANGRHRGELTLFTRNGDPLGARTIESDNRDCRSLDDALAVTLAILLNMHRAEIRSLHPPSPWSFRGSAAAGLVFGLLPRPGLEIVAGGGGVHDKGVGLDLELAFDSAQRAQAAEGAITVRAAGARLSASVALVSGARELRLRLAATAGPMWASAANFPSVSQETRLFGEGRVGLQWNLRIAGPVWTQIGGDIGWLPIRPDFVVTNPGGGLETLFRPGPLVGSFVAGFAFRTD